MRRTYIMTAAAALCAGILCVVPIFTGKVSRGQEERTTLTLLYTVNNVGYLSPCG